MVWAPAHTPRAPGGRGVTPEGPWGRRAAMGGEERRKAPHIGRHRPRRGHFPPRSCGVPRCLFVRTKHPVSACPPSEVTATLTAAAIRREATSLRMAAAVRVTVTSEGGHAETGFLVPNKKAPRNPATASGEMASPRSMPADVGHLAAFLTPHRSPPAPGALWGHAPPTWRPGGMCRRPNHARFGPWLGQRPRAGPGLC